MMGRKKFSYKKFEKDRDKATELSKSGFRLDTLTDDLCRVVEARKRAVKNAYILSDKDFVVLRERAQMCKAKSACGWCIFPVVNKTKPECKICDNNT